MRKTGYHALAGYLLMKDIDLEVTEVLDLITEIASQAKPLRDEDGS
jgi:hypothetical protein